MFQRKSNVFILYLGAILLLFSLTMVHAQIRQRQDEHLAAEKRHMVGEYELSDLALFTDARYTRHPSIADLNTPFQDYPFSFEHFPSGSIVPLPPHLIPHGQQRTRHAGN
jgi:hypothetical protein